MLNSVFDLIENDATQFPESPDSNSRKQHWFINAVEKLELESATNKKEEKSISSSISDSSIFLSSKLIDQIFERQALGEKKAYDEAVEEQMKELLQVLRYFSVETDEISSAERKIIDIVNMHSFRFLGDVIQKIYLQYNDFPTILVGICRSLERFDYREVMPWGPTMLMGLLNHKSDLVKESAIGLVENWASTDFLPALRNIECKSNWMQDYINDIVHYLEGCNVLHKKTV